MEDLPIGPRADFPAARDRERITRDLLEILARHGIRVVAFVRGDRIEDAWDEALLRLWVDAGHELGNHAFSVTDYTRTPTEELLADAERNRELLLPLVRPTGRTIRFFRFPMLREPETPGKRDALRDYLRTTRQTAVPVTIRDPGRSPASARPHASGDRTTDDTDEDYAARLRLAVTRSERIGDRLFDRTVPQILALRAGPTGAAHWDALFDWLAANGYRFVTVDQVLDDPALSSSASGDGSAGYTLWDRLDSTERRRDAEREVRELLETQIAAWNRGDLEAFCSVYDDDALFLSPNGVNRGRKAILGRYRARYPDRAAMGTLELQIIHVDLAQGPERTSVADPAPGEVHGAAVAARWFLSYPDRESASGETSITLRRRDGRWLIVLDASM